MDTTAIYGKTLEVGHHDPAFGNGFGLGGDISAMRIRVT
jgi:hypothetical protein